MRQTTYKRRKSVINPRRNPLKPSFKLVRKQAPSPITEAWALLMMHGVCVFEAKPNVWQFSYILETSPATFNTQSQAMEAAAWFLFHQASRQARKLVIDVLVKLDEALGVLSGKARIEGVQRDIHTRLASHDGEFYLDLCDEERRAVKLCADGWTVINAKDAPVKFRRAKGMMPLPVPAAGGDAKLLRPFVNVASEEDFTLLLCWLVAALRADAVKYPVLSLTGEQGSAKSTVTLFLRNLFDPNFAPLRNSLRNQWDAILAANNSFCIALNNLSGLPQELSDTLVCIADGAGFATRTHHSMTEETLFHTRRPIIANGISDIATRQDLLDRAICLHLPAIASSNRVSDDKLIAE